MARKKSPRGKTRARKSFLNKYLDSRIGGFALIFFLLIFSYFALKFVKAQTTPDTTPPSFPCCVKPDPQEVVNGTITINPNVYDESGISKVELTFWNNTVGDTGVPTMTDTTAPFEFVWNSAELPDAQRNYVVKAWDIYGNVSDNLSASFYVMNNPTYPAIQIISPLPGSTVSGTINVEASVSADKGVDHVQFYRWYESEGAWKLMTTFQNSPYRYAFTPGGSTYTGSERWRIRAFEKITGDPGEKEFQFTVNNCLGKGSRCKGGIRK